MGDEAATDIVGFVAVFNGFDEFDTVDHYITESIKRFRVEFSEEKRSLSNSWGIYIACTSLSLSLAHSLALVARDSRLFVSASRNFMKYIIINGDSVIINIDRESISGAGCAHRNLAI